MSEVADICLIAEGSYPFVSGGVSGWMHDMIRELDEFSFHVVSLMPKNNGFEKKYALPDNVVSHETIYLQHLPQGKKRVSKKSAEIHERLRPLLAGLVDGVPFDQASLGSLVRVLATYRGELTQSLLLDDMAAWDTMLAAYGNGYSHLSFLDFFWTYRVMIASLASTLLAPLPPAKIYHTASTGYAGLLAARAKAETGSPALMTEHGIYTNERRIEIVAAEWLQQHREGALTAQHLAVDLRDMWMKFFRRIGRLAYDSSDRIVTLFAENQQAQQMDGADPARMQVIPNGIDVAHYGGLPRTPHATPTIALIGRVVPIKDVKSYLQAVAILARNMPEVKALIIGALDEDPDYVQECRDLSEWLGLASIVEFTGLASLDDYLPVIDLVVLTSISEAQPLVLLEAGACGIPLVAPDVGACGEIIRGTVDEHPAPGAGGIVTPLANPAATAEAIGALLGDRDRYHTASRAIKARVTAHYPKARQYDAYRELYQHYLK